MEYSADTKSSRRVVAMQISREYLESEMKRKRSGTSVTRGDVLRQPFDTWSSAKTSLRVSMSPFGRSHPRFEFAVSAVPVKTTIDQLLRLRCCFLPRGHPGMIWRGKVQRSGTHRILLPDRTHQLPPRSTSSRHLGQDAILKSKLSELSLPRPA